MPRLLVIGLLICGFCLLFVQPSRAQFVTYSVSGHVTSFDDPGATLFPQVSAGDLLTGTIRLNQSFPGLQFPDVPFGNVGIFLDLPGVHFQWSEFNYFQNAGTDEVMGSHAVGQTNWNAVDVGSDLLLKPGGAFEIDGLEGATGDRFVVNGVFDSVHLVPEGNSYLLFGSGLLLPMLALGYARRKHRQRSIP